MLATFKFTGASLRLFGMDLSQHPFTTGGRRLLFPGVLRDEVFAWAALLAFVLCAAADLIKRGYEVAQRSLNVPKTLHMTLWPPACSSSCAVERRCVPAGANPARQLSLQPEAVGAVRGGNELD